MKLCMDGLAVLSDCSCHCFWFQIAGHSRYLKEELACIIDECLLVISNIILFEVVNYITKKLRNKAVLSLKQYWLCKHCYVVLSNVCNKLKQLWDSIYSKWDSRIILSSTIEPFKISLICVEVCLC